MVCGARVTPGVEPDGPPAATVVVGAATSAGRVVVEPAWFGVVAGGAVDAVVDELRASVVLDRSAVGGAVVDVRVADEEGVAAAERLGVVVGPRGDHTRHDGEEDRTRRQHGQDLAPTGAAGTVATVATAATAGTPARVARWSNASSTWSRTPSRAPSGTVKATRVGPTASDPSGATRARSPLLAAVAVVDVAGNALAGEHREGAVPVGQDHLEPGAVGLALAGDEQGTDGAGDPLAHAAGDHGDLPRGHARGLGQLGALEAVAHVQLQQDAVAVVEALGGVPQEAAHLRRGCGGGRGIGREVVVGGAGHHRVLGGHGLGAGPSVAGALVAGDGVQPGRSAEGSRSWSSRWAAATKVSWVASAAACGSLSRRVQKARTRGE